MFATTGILLKLKRQLQKSINIFSKFPEDMSIKNKSYITYLLKYWDTKI